MKLSGIVGAQVNFDVPNVSDRWWELKLYRGLEGDFRISFNSSDTTWNVEVDEDNFRSKIAEFVHLVANQPYKELTRSVKRAIGIPLSKDFRCFSLWSGAGCQSIQFDLERQECRTVIPFCWQGRMAA